MKQTFTVILILCLVHLCAGQASLVKVKNKTYKTTKEVNVKGQVGYLEVLENRQNPRSRKIQVKYIWLKSLAENPTAPVVYLEGGGGTSTWQAEDPQELTYWLELLKTSDLIFVDRRGTKDKKLEYRWKGNFPENFFVSEQAADLHYQNMAAAALKAFEERGVDVKGHTIESHAQDVHELMGALGIDRYAIFGFSFGSHIGMAAMQLFPDEIVRAIFAGADAPNQSFNYPRYLDLHIEKIAQMVAADTSLRQQIPDFTALVTKVMDKLAATPVTVTVRNPLTLKKMPVKIGAFGLGLILRLDIDDYNDIPVIPRLLYTLDQGNTDILAWFVQKRLKYSLGVTGNGLNQQLASGVDPARWATIEQQAAESLFGHAVNFPFSAVKDHWIDQSMSFDPSIPVETDIPTLFITGTLDCRTAVAQVDETMKGFQHAVHVKVENAGHEQAYWDREVNDEIIPAFLRGEKIKKTEVYYADLKFIPVTGAGTGHPSLE
ncbi:MAG: alpha/beta hydrolase [Bacteroidota bacterium]